MTFFDIPSGQAPQPAPAFEDDTKSHLDADEWEDEQAVTPIEDSEQLITHNTHNTTRQPKKSLAERIHSVHRPKRLKSRGRQKAQNARAGIKLITDFSGFRKPSQQQQQQQKNSPGMTSKSKFVDLTALRALEGSPNSASTGSWNWLKRQKSGASPNHLAPSSVDVGLSPDDRPIMIGISMDEGALAGKEISPQTAAVGTPPGLPRIQTNAVSPISTTKSTTPVTPSQLRSVWSPDTPASASTVELEGRRATSSVYSQGASATANDRAGVPPVPEVPASFKVGLGLKAPMSAVSEEEVDTGTPCTLFEEDATPTSAKARQRQRLASRNFNQSIISDTITEWWDEDEEVQSPATGMTPAPLRLAGTRDPITPVVQQSHAHQVNITNITVAAPTLVSISRPETERSAASTPAIIGGTPSPLPTQQLPREPAGFQGSFTNESRNGSRSAAARAQSTFSDAVTEIWDGEQEPAAQTNAATSLSRTRGDLIGIAVSPSSPVAPPTNPQRDLAQGSATIQGGRSEGSMQLELSGSRFPARSESHAPVQWATSRQSPAPTRTESPARTASPAHRHSPGSNPSPAWSQSQGRNQSPARSTPRLALGAATMSSSDRASPRRADTGTDQAETVAEENVAASEEPPPYSPPRRNLQAPPRFCALFPPDHPLHGRFPPSPGPVSPGVSRTMTSQGAVDMTEIPLTPGPAPADSEGRTRGFPAEHYGAVESRQDRVERRRLEEERKQHEKERKRLEKERKREEGGGGGFGLLMKLRHLLPKNQSTAAAPPAAAGGAAAPVPGKPIWPWVAGGAVALIILAAVLAGVLTRKGGSGSGDKDDRFVDFPGFPPMPTGILTVVGPENSHSDDRCTEPSTLWSCELPPEQHGSVAPFKPSQPTVVMHIQVDNTSRASWDVPNGNPPVPKPGSDNSDDDSKARLRRSSTLGRRLGRRLAPGIEPEPAPPSFEEMFFLGNTTDGIVSDDKAGESTPFYISLLESASDSAGPDIVQKRAIRPRQKFADELPDPEVEEDGSGAPARLFPRATQQPVRLYDRGLPTEHYGFYTYFRRTIYLRGISPNDTSSVAADQDGGAPKGDAKFIVTWSETRFVVKLWTDGGKELLGGKGERPGTMPYPVTMQLDTHGGDAGAKFVWAWQVEDGKIDAEDPRFLLNDIEAGGEVVNPRLDKNRSFGGVDGGVGGCGCEWVNFRE